MKRLNSFMVPIVVISTICFDSCGIFSGGNNMARRYRNTNNVHLFDTSNDSQSFLQVEMNSYTIKRSDEQMVKYNLLSLSPDGQKEFIKSITSKSGSLNEMREQLNTNFSFSKDQAAKVKLISKTVSKSLSFSINRPYYESATNKVIFNLFGDRVASLELIIKLKDKSVASFNSWDRFLTDHLTLNLGKVSSAQEWNANIDLSAKAGAEVSLGGNNATEAFDSETLGQSSTIGNTSPSANITDVNSTASQQTNKVSKSSSSGRKASSDFGGSASVSYGEKFETALDLNAQIIKLTGTLREDKIVLRQESGPGIDLSGNVVISLEYSIADDWAAPVHFVKFTKLYSDDNPLDIDSLNVQTLTVMFPDIKNDVLGELDYSFLYRQVNKGNRHIPEARQKVKYWYGNVLNKDNKIQVQPLVLIKKSDIRPKVFRIKGNSDFLALNTIPLNFETASEAISYLRYVGDLIQKRRSVVHLLLGSISFNKTDYPSLKIVTENL